MEKKTRNYILDIVILSLMTIGFLVLSVDVGLSKKELEKEIKISAASTVHDFRETEIDGEIFHTCKKCHFTIRNRPHKDLELYYDNSSIKATKYDLTHCESFPISFEFSRKIDGVELVNKLVEAHDIIMDPDPEDIWASHVTCRKCDLRFRYNHYSGNIAFNKDVHSFDELMECKE